MNAPFATLAEQCPTFVSPYTLAALVVGLLVGCALCGVWSYFEDKQARQDRNEHDGVIG